LCDSEAVHIPAGLVITYDPNVFLKSLLSALYFGKRDLSIFPSNCLLDGKVEHVAKVKKGM